MEVTKHAIKRGKERFSWNKKAVLRMVDKAYTKGQDTSTMCSNVRIWVESRNTNGYKVKVLGSAAFVFSNNTLVTIIKLTKGLRNLIIN